MKKETVTEEQVEETTADDIAEDFEESTETDEATNEDKTIAEELEDTLDNMADDLDTPEIEEDPSPSETDEETLDSFLPKDGDIFNPDGRDKRINKLTKEKYEYKASIDALKAEISELRDETTKPDKNDKVYSKSELSNAMKRAMEDQDSALVLEIVEQMNKQTESKLRKEYTSELNREKDALKKQEDQWTTVQEQYA